MKRTIFALMLCFVSIMSFSQIQIQSEGKTKSTTEAKKEASYIRWENDGYYFRILDYKCSKFHLNGEKYVIKIYLGKNAQEVQQSGDLIQQWFNKAKNEEFINVSNPDGQGICLYKFNLNLYASYGNEMLCKATRLQFGADMAVALAGGGYATKKERDEFLANVEFGDYVLTGLCSFKSDFMKSIKNFKEPGQVSPKVRQKIAEQITTVKKEIREAGLNESVCMQNYDIIMRELMRSDKESDWTTIDHANSIMLDLTKSRGKINRAELEEKLIEQETISGKIDVFEEFFQYL